MSTAAAPKTDQPRPPRPKLSSRDRRVLDSLFAIDTRALAVLRILLAGLILFEALVLEWNRPRDPQGPVEMLVQYGDVIVIPFAVMMLFGYKTRVAVLACWLTYSLRIRADLLAPGVSVEAGDFILNLALFWSIFLPLGRHLSVDDKGRTAVPARFLSLGGAALLLQIFIIYFSAGVTKDMGEWVGEATALQTILAHPTYDTSLGLMMLNYPSLLAAMSVATIILEIAGPLLLFIPGRTLQTRRLIVVPLFILLHVGMAMFMDLGLFPYVMIAIWLIFLPSSFWDRFWAWLKKPRVDLETIVDRSRWRTIVAGVAVVIAAVSNAITWLYYPDIVGVAEHWQTVATYLMLYQQWAMFSVPSSL